MEDLSEISVPHDHTSLMCARACVWVCWWVCWWVWPVRVCLVWSGPYQLGEWLDRLSWDESKPRWDGLGRTNRLGRLRFVGSREEEEGSDGGGGFVSLEGLAGELNWCLEPEL